MVDRNVTVPMTHGYDLGLGVDSLSLDAKDHVVDGAATTPQGGSGSDTTFVMQRVESTSDLMKALGVDVDVSVGSVLFGAGATDRFSYAQSQHVQSSSLFMTVSAGITLPDLSIDSPTLSGNAQAVVGTPTVFHARYGDSFVKTVVRGGLFVGVLRIDSSSETDAQTISNQLSGTYGLVASADVGVKITSTASRFHSSVSVDLFSVGGPVLHKPADPSALVSCLDDFLTAFQQAPDANAQIFQVVLAPIQDAEGPLPPNSVDIEHAQETLSYCARLRLTVLDNLNLVSDFIARPDRFDFPTDFQPADAQKLSNGLQADLDVIAQCASAAMNNPIPALEPADFARTVGKQFPQGIMPIHLPILKPTVVQATLKIADYSGLDISDIDTTWRYLTIYTVDQILAGIINEPDAGNYQTPLNRDQVVCLSYAQNNQLSIEYLPAGLSGDSDSATIRYVVGSQSVQGGTMVAPGSELDLQFVEQPV